MLFVTVTGWGVDRIYTIHPWNLGVNIDSKHHLFGSIRSFLRIFFVKIIPSNHHLGEMFRLFFPIIIMAKEIRKHGDGWICFWRFWTWILQGF